MAGHGARWSDGESFTVVETPSRSNTTQANGFPSASGRYLIDFTAVWCKPCQAIAGDIVRLESEGVRVHRCDIDADPKLAARYGVTAIPCLVSCDSQWNELARLEGRQTIENIRAMLATSRAETSRPARQVGTPGVAAPAPRRSGGLATNASAVEARSYEQAFCRVGRDNVSSPGESFCGGGVYVGKSGGRGIAVTCRARRFGRRRRGVGRYFRPSLPRLGRRFRQRP